MGRKIFCDKCEKEIKKASDIYSVESWEFKTWENAYAWNTIRQVSTNIVCNDCRQTILKGLKGE